jgi:hypothetical protein
VQVSIPIFPTEANKENEGGFGPIRVLPLCNRSTVGFFQMGFHLSECLTNPAADGLFGTPVPEADLGARLTFDEARGRP